MPKYIIIIIRLNSLLQPAVLRLRHRIIDFTVWAAKKNVQEQDFLH